MKCLIMIDLAILAGLDSKLPVVEDGYYLQEMGIDIWRLRDIKPRRILVLLEELKNDTVSAERQSLLLENILLSTNIPRANFDVIYDGYELKKRAPGFDRYATIIIMGQNMPDNIVCTNSSLSKPAAESKLRGDSERRTEVYTQVHEDSITKSTKQFASAVGLEKRSNVLILPHLSQLFANVEAKKRVYLALRTLG